MVTARNLLTLGVAFGALSLGGCANFDVKVPHLDADAFGTCMAYPPSSYQANVAMQPSAELDNFNKMKSLTAQNVQPTLLSFTQTVAVASTRAKKFDTSTSRESTNFATDKKALALLFNPNNEKGVARKREDVTAAEEIAAVRMIFGENIEEKQVGDLAKSIDKARVFMNHPVNKKFADLYNDLASTDGDSPQKTSFSLSETRDFLNLAQEIEAEDGFMFFGTNELMNALNETSRGRALTDERVTKSVRAFVQMAYVRAYLRAYFRNGDFLKAKLTVSDIVAKIPELSKMPEADKTKLNDLIKNLASFEFGKIADAGFVSRTGAPSMMQAINITFDPTQPKKLTVGEIDYNIIGGEIVRVILEALFDSYDRLPGVSDATGRKVFEGNHPLNLSVFPPEKVGGGAPYYFGEKEFGEIEKLSNAADATVSTLAGEVLRGLNVVALNNEALAKVIEALVGTTARKVTERAGWCYYYASRLDNKSLGVTSKLFADAGPPRTMRKVEVHVGW